MQAVLMKKRVLLVEDDLNLSAVLRENLLFEGFEVDSVADGALALDRARAFMPDLVVLDIVLPNVNGFVLCSILRRNGGTPVLMVSARSQKIDKIRALNLGADDYIEKPFDLDEFIARVNAVLRRARPSTDDLVLGDIKIDFLSHSAKRGNRTIHLTNREFELLKYLAERPGRVVSRDELLRVLWEYPEMALTRSVDHAIGRLRKKVEPDPQQPRFIHTAVGVGYSLTPDGAQAPRDTSDGESRVP
jgi:DNA-binding response OmpR family regulator